MGNKLAWGFSGALFGFGILALASIGIFVLIVAAGMTVPLLVLRAPGFPWFLIGGGLTFAGTWLSLVVDPNAPDNAVWPIVVGVAIAALGFALGRRSTPSALSA